MVLSRRGWLVASVALFGGCTCLDTCHAYNEPACRRADTGLADGAALDTSEVGAPNDTARDAPSPADADATAACTDAATDPCWVRMEGLPGHCDVWRAQHPERLVTAVPMSCGTGCTLLELDHHWLSSHEGGWIDSDGARYVHLVSGDAGTGTDWVDAIVRSDGRTVLALEYPPNGGTISVETCRTTSFAVGEGFGAFDVSWVLGSSAVPAHDIVYYAPLAELATVTTPTRDVDTSGTLGILQLAASSRGVVWEREAGGQGVIDGTYIDFGDGLHHPRMVGGDVLWINQSGQLHMWSAGVDTMLYDLSPLIADAGVLTDGANIGWFEFVDMPLSSSTLRVGPYARTAAAFTTRVVEGPGLVALSGVMGDGLVAHEDYAPGSPPTFLGYRVVDVATRTARRWVPPAGQHPSYLHLVSSTELVVEMRDSAGYHLYVIDPSSLPPAT